MYTHLQTVNIKHQEPLLPYLSKDTVIKHISIQAPKPREKEHPKTGLWLAGFGGFWRDLPRKREPTPANPWPVFQLIPVFSPLHNLPNPPLRRLSSPHLNPCQGIIQLLSDLAHLLHTAGEANLLPMIDNLSYRRNHGCRTAQAALGKISQL